jgi:hypothetical protein
MSQVRRRVLRAVSESPSTARQSHRRERQQEQLEADRVALRRWMTKLKRAFNTVDRLSARIARLERHLAR